MPQQSSTHAAGFKSRRRRWSKESGKEFLAEGERPPLHAPTQDAVDLSKTVQVVCRFQADELLDRLPVRAPRGPHSTPPIARAGPTPIVAGCSRAASETLPPKPWHLAARNPSAPPIRLDPTTLVPRPDSPACFAIAAELGDGESFADPHHVVQRDTKKIKPEFQGALTPETPACYDCWRPTIFPTSVPSPARCSAGRSRTC